ncbi:MAG: YdeI/OmpD-associated family protein [Chloroflexaceae bacterium]|nr:YdeI/OmpD-associated family protein [Chloroflexaceae bacterium]
MIKTEHFEQVEVTSVAELRAWLEANHRQEASIWLVTYKKHTGAKYVSIAQVLDEVLCFGWIDGIRRKLDDDRTMQLLGPRRTQHWARTYKERVARLEREGRMHPAGLAAIAEAKRLDLWDAMDDVDDLVIPADLSEALQRLPPAAEHFAAFSTSSRRNVLRWIKLAKTPETRARRIEQTATLAARNEKVPQMG